MSSKPFNFDIRNYTINDLQDIFELPNQYDSNVIEIKETKLREKLLGNPKLTPKLKQDTIQFITSAKIKLQENIKSTKQINSPHPYIIENPLLEEKEKAGTKREIKKHINIDTRFRDNLQQLSSDFDINFSFKLTNVIKMELSSIEFPTTFYAISDLFGNNYFTIRVNTIDDLDSYNIITYTALFQLPDGNYSKTSLINEIKNLDNYSHDIPSGSSGSSELINIFQYINLAVDVDNEGSGTGKSIFTLDASLSSYDVTSVEFLFNENKKCAPDNIDIVKKLGWMLGFREERYVSDTSSNNFEIKSESLLDITAKYLYLVIDDHNSNNETMSYFHSGFNSVVLNKNILARIPLTTFSFSFEVANMLNIVSTPRQYTSPLTIDKISVQVIDEYGRVVDLNGMNMSFCLTFTINYDK